MEGCEPDVLANFEQALRRLEKSGVKIERQDLPAFDSIMSLSAARGTILAAEALHLHWDRVHSTESERMDARVARRILQAERMTAVDLVEILQSRRRLIAEVSARIGHSLVAFPTTPLTAPEIAPLEADQDQFFKANARALRNTSLGNFLDWCGVSIPCGTDRNGLPTGFLLSAPHGRDRQLLAAGWGMEALVNPAL
jgi:aspartyl-tRNA(Asn)/glutamyl-tRNA(Gln) amidotransferase subunit A